MASRWSHDSHDDAHTPPPTHHTHGRATPVVIMAYVRVIAMIYAATLAVAASWASVAATLKVNTDTTMFVDEYGRERYFHGTNVVYKAVRRSAG